MRLAEVAGLAVPVLPWAELAGRLAAPAVARHTRRAQTRAHKSKTVWFSFFPPVLGKRFARICLTQNQNPTGVSASRVRQRYNSMPAAGRACAYCADESRKWIPLRLKPSTLEQQACPNVARNLVSFSTWRQAMQRALVRSHDTARVPAGQWARYSVACQTRFSIGLYQGIVKLS